MKKWLTLVAVVVSLCTLLSASVFASNVSDKTQKATVKENPGKYASVNGLKMYYEIHGKGQPLVLLHGAYESINSFGKILPSLAKTRQVIAVEIQGHGRTADIDRPFSYEYWADDVVALLDHLKIKKADILGFSKGGGIAMELATQHPDRVRKLIVASATYSSKGIHPEITAGLELITPEVFAGTPIAEEYAKLAPNPKDFPKLVEKFIEMDRKNPEWSPESIAAIKAPTLTIIGDSDIIRNEYAVEMFNLLGGGVAGDLVGLPQDQLAILPGTAHRTLMQNSKLMLPIIIPFLDAPMPKAK